MDKNMIDASYNEKGCEVAKKAYQSPRLTEWGSLKNLTNGTGGGSKIDSDFSPTSKVTY